MAEKKTSQDCWNVIGVQGDASCPELDKAIHCRNCPVFSAAGRGLLEQAFPRGYLEKWGHILAQNKEVESAADLSLIVFRLGDEWLALRTKFSC